VTSDALSVTGIEDIVTDNELSVTLDEPCVTDNEPCATDDVTDNPCKYLGANIHLDRDHHQSIIYDVSEEGFKRRNKHWMTHAESYRKEIRAGAIRRKAERIEQVAAVKARREAVKYAGVE